MLKICTTVLLCSTLLVACNRREPQPPPTLASPAPKLPIVQVSEPPLDRAAVLDAIGRAANAAALGLADQGQADLDGKRFEVRMRFGCPGASADSRTRRWSLDTAKHILRVAVDPEITRDSPELKWVVSGDFEDAEGFWLYRPWLQSAGCVRVENDREAGGEAPGKSEPGIVAEPPRVGIVQIYRETDTRSRRRDRRGLKVTKAMPDAMETGGEGFDLVVEGRLRAQSGQPVISCRVVSDSLPPSCLITGTFDRTAIELPDSHEVLAEWSGS
ncbi:hypothetical protein ACFO0A_14130 [Novosphingobium tardum]|uniref:Lipoprotein n=1 Tax=Novosphingobium tardum TaxID=1538021 RepID=A0ABV8RSR2_9SPHN